MNKLPTLNLPQYPFRSRISAGNEEIWDDIRHLWLRLTPEEWVRQHFIRMMVGTMGIDPNYIVQEYPIPLNRTAQRADIVVVDRDKMPLMIVECKAPNIKLNKITFAQALRYNSVVGAKYLAITNGQKHILFENDGREYKQLNELPDLSPFFRVD